MLYKNYVAYVNSVAIRLNVLDDFALKTPSELFLRSSSRLKM